MGSSLRQAARRNAWRSTRSGSSAAQSTLKGQLLRSKPLARLTLGPCEKLWANYAVFGARRGPRPLLHGGLETPNSRLSGERHRGNHGHRGIHPDIIVYAGARAVLAESLAELSAKLKSALAENTPPRPAVVRKVGSFLLADNPVGLDAAEEVAICAARLARLAVGRGGTHVLSPQAAGFIINWEAERYRASLLEAKAAPPAGKVALVTGAGSGFGAGIAWGLVGAGAAMALCDLDERAAAEAAQASPEAGRTLVVHADVTKEEQVAAAFDQLVGHWGGMDIVVCAAGIPAAGELLDLPLQT